MDKKSIQARWTAWPATGLASATVVTFCALSALSALSAASCAVTEEAASSMSSPMGASSGSGSGGAGGGEEDAGLEAAPMCGDCSAVEAPQCFTAVCDEMKGECVVVPTEGGEACDDGLFCTVDETCSNGVCGKGSSNSCELMTDECHVVACDETMDACSLEPLPDGSFCSIADLCTVNTECKAGVCTGAAKDCFFAPVPDFCHVSACNPLSGDCEPVPGNDGKACPEDGDPCMLNKKCFDGSCQGGVPKDCSALTSPCNVGGCNAVSGQCEAQPFGIGDPCQEAVNECNTGMCDANGSCVPVPTPGVACPSATNACNAGSCNDMGVCVGAPINEAGACDDGNACTTGEICTAGSCAGGVVNNYVVYFSDTFADNSAGWTFNQPGNPASQQWQIGPTTTSACQNSGNADPAQDHTTTLDNGIAGVALGGCPAKAIHGYYYLESPVINTNVQGAVWLEYWRYLNSDFKPYMKNMIEVWSGTAWEKVWESGGLPPINDSAWTRVTYELTPFKNAEMRVRFGFEVQNTFGFMVSAWNIDDVIISDNICN